MESEHQPLQLQLKEPQPAHDSPARADPVESHQPSRRVYGNVDDPLMFSSCVLLPETESRLGRFSR